MTDDTPAPQLEVRRELADYPATLALSLAAFQGDMPPVGKTKTARVPMKSGGSYSYKYADLADVVKAASPVLSRLGLSFTCSTGPDDNGRLQIVATLLHVSGETREGALPIHGSDPQQIGGALTYARRYLFGCLTGIVTDEDTDAQGVEPQQASARGEAPREPEGPPIDMTTATADETVVLDFRGRVLRVADNLPPGQRQQSLGAIVTEASVAGALGCEVRVPPGWAGAAPSETVSLYSLIRGASQIAVKSGEGDDGAEPQQRSAQQSANGATRHGPGEPDPYALPTDPDERAAEVARREAHHEAALERARQERKGR